MTTIVIGTRGSELALWQANHIRDALMKLDERVRVELKVIVTEGDKLAEKGTGSFSAPFAENVPVPFSGQAKKGTVPFSNGEKGTVPGDKGLFTRRIETALLDGEVSLAVHSLKDLPTESPAGLTLAAIPAREDPADALVAKEGRGLSDLPAGGVVLSGSLRRRAQLLHLRPDLKVEPVRGNVPTRLRKLDESDACATVLARAGLVRLGLADCITERLDPERFLPACGQGALALQSRQDDSELRVLLARLDDPTTRAAVAAERAFLATLGGGCQAPVGAYATGGPSGTPLRLTGMVASLDGARLVRSAVEDESGAPDAAERLGRHLAEELLAAGGRAILDELIQRPPKAMEAGG